MASPTLGHRQDNGGHDEEATDGKRHGTRQREEEADDGLERVSCCAASALEGT